MPALDLTSALRCAVGLAILIGCRATKGSSEAGAPADAPPADVSGQGGAGGSGGSGPDGSTVSGADARLDGSTVSGGDAGRADTPPDGPPEKSPGTVTLRLTVSSGRSYCDQDTLCSTTPHIFVRDPAGRVLLTALPFCQPICSQLCAPPQCPGFPCVPMGSRFTGGDFVWSGVYYDSSTCGGGAGCFIQRFARPGRYTAAMCATPGALSAPDGGGPVCAKEAQRCVELPFDFPSSTVVEGTL
jgi:hypothetical protein